MPLKVKRQPKESTQSLIQRFLWKVKKSGILLEARKRMFYQRKKKSWQMKKRSALYREQKRKEYEKLKKLGKI